MQSSEVISINLWQIIISLCNLLILFLILKKFLYSPVRKLLAQRQKDIDDSYKAAQAAEELAGKNKAMYEEKLKTADSDAAEIVRKAKAKAAKKSDKIVAEAKDKADDIVKQAETEAFLEKKKAEFDIQREIAEVSAALAEKIIEREIKTEDHREFINSFIKELGENNDGNK